MPLKRRSEHKSSLKLKSENSHTSSTGTTDPHLPSEVINCELLRAKTCLATAMNGANNKKQAAQKMQRGKLLERDSVLYLKSMKFKFVRPRKSQHSLYGILIARIPLALVQHTNISYGCWLPESLFVWLFVSFGRQAIEEKLCKNKTISFMS